MGLFAGACRFSRIYGLFFAARGLDPDEELNLTGQWMKALGITFILGVFSILPLGFALSVAAYSNWDRP